MPHEIVLSDRLLELDIDLGTITGKRIVIVLGSLEMGGAERQALHLARYLKELGAHIEMWGFHGPGLASDACDSYGIPWRVVPFAWSTRIDKALLNTVRVGLTLRGAKPDIVMPYTSYPNVICGLTWRSTGAKVCVWNQRDMFSLGLGKPLESLAMRNTPVYIANSSYSADFMSHEWGIDRSEIRVIHNGVQLLRPQREPSEWQAQLGVKPATLVACMIANVSLSRKDHSTLLRAWRRVVNEHDGVLLLAGLMGDGHEKIRDLTSDLGLHEHVKFLGQVEDIAGLLQIVDLGVFSSRVEGCPNGVLECMAAGLSIAGTDIPGLREAVGHENEVYLAPECDDRALAAIILRLARDPDLRLRLGEANRLRIAREFGVQEMCMRTVHVALEAMIGKR